MTTPSAADPSDRARSFQLGARQYRKARPGYPREAAEWLTPGPGAKVLDLAAGTGKLTETLLQLDGLDIVAVEPSDAMRAELVDALPGVRALPGTAEDIPLPDGDRDGVVVAQAWHWFDPATALPEIARVLRPGGRLGVVWNVRDHTVDWVEAFTEIIHRGDSLEPNHGPPTIDDHFEDLEHQTFRWYQSLPRTELRTLAASRSHLLTLAPDARDELLDAVDHLVATHPDLRDRETLVLPYRTESWRARRP
ncbi:MAG: methyltransferase domain-containing protein [Actinomycetales bacterium]|nr:methyltransferase domain-containing protein [Actinomycetales bacterium]